jgi:hypothetical protein
MEQCSSGVLNAVFPFVLSPILIYICTHAVFLSLSFAQTFLLEGELPILDFLGIVFGHVYYHCKKVGLLRAPQFVIDWYQGDSSLSQSLRRKYKEIAADFQLP